MIPLLLTRWRVGLYLAAGLTLLGFVMAAHFYRHAYHAEKALRAADRAAYAQAQAEAARIAQEALRHTEAVYQAKAQGADHAYQADLADARTAAAAYIARMRVKAPGGATGQAPASATGDGSGLRAGLPSGAFVAVTDTDVQACTESTSYALKLREWALAIGE